MRRVNVWLLVPAVLLALGVGVLVGRAGDDDGDAAAGRTDVLGQQFERSQTTTTPDETTTTTEAEATTTTAAVTTTTVQAATATTTAATATTAAPAATTTTRGPDPNCGPGRAAASANLTVTGDGPPSDPVFTYSGAATVANNTGKAIELTALVLRLESSDGTSQDVAVAGAAGAVIESGVTRDFAFTHKTSHPPKQGGASVAAFSYKPPGGTRNCASI